MLLPRFISIDYYPSLCLRYYLFVHLFNTLSLFYLYSFVPFTNYGWDFYIAMYLQFQILLLTTFVRTVYYPISQACNSFTLVYEDNHFTFEPSLVKSSKKKVAGKLNHCSSRHDFHNISIMVTILCQSDSV